MTRALIPDFIANRIGGVELAAASERTMDLVAPHDASRIAKVASSDAVDVDRAVKAARVAQPGWARTTPVARGEVLHRICNSLEARKEELAAIVMAEAGKRLPDAMGEANAAILCGRFFAGEGQRLYGRTSTSAVDGKWSFAVRQPCGIAGLIIAANTPAPNFAWKVFPALICGNAVVLKSADDTPASASFMAKVAEEAGLPAGVLNVVHGTGLEAGQPLVEHPDVDVISFTGSTRVGRIIGEAAGRQLKKVSLELGGKNPLVVCEDADLDNAVRFALLSSFSNAGQRCAASSRIIVFDSVYDEFLHRFVAAAKALKLGVEADCDVGPVISRRQLEAMLAAVDRARAAGATVHCGGERAGTTALAAGFYMLPTVLSGIAADAELSRVELFGPITAVYRVAGMQEALALGNSSPYGLTACVHTRDINRALAFVERFEAGITVVNGGTHGSEPHMPFGGTKASGNGTREPGTEALDIYSQLKQVYVLAKPV